MKCFIENFRELDIDELLAVNGGYGSSSGGGYVKNSSGTGSYGNVTTSSGNQSSWDVWVNNKDGRNSSGEITRPHDPYRDMPKNSGNYDVPSFVPENNLGGGTKKEEDSILGAPTDSRRITGVVGEKTTHQDAHTGVDIGAMEPGVKGDPIYAVEDGEILRVGTTGSGSSILEQDLPNSNDTAVYQHGDFVVEAGDTVERGEVIGYMSDIGTPGQVHLHFEVRDDGQYAGPGGSGEIVNPLDYLPDSYNGVNQ